MDGAGREAEKTMGRCFGGERLHGEGNETQMKERGFNGQDVGDGSKPLGNQGSRQDAKRGKGWRERALVCGGSRGGGRG